jgi:hypothetical protein
MPVVTDNLLGAYLRDRRTRLDPAAFDADYDACRGGRPIRPTCQGSNPHTHVMSSRDAVQAAVSGPIARGSQ